MQRRIASFYTGSRRCGVLFFLTGLIACTGTLRGSAQEAKQGDPASDLPTVLLVMQRPANETIKPNDPNLDLRFALNKFINESGRFRALIFSPSSPLITRALRDNTIAADDLVEPYKMDGLERIARSVGARFILNFHAVLDKSEMKTETRFYENATPQDWIVRFDDKIAWPLVMGKKKLKPEDLTNLTVDAIATRLGLPSHLAESLRHLETVKIIEPTRNGKKPADKSKNDKSAAADKPGVKTDKSALPTGTPPGDKKPAGNAAANSNDKNPPVVAKNDKPDKTPSVLNPGPVTPPKNPAFSPDPNAGRGNASLPTGVTPPSARVDYESQALRYRQTGDLANTITSLRHAVNERPRDIELRRQLILAYRERQMPEAAVAENLRALELEPKNGSLYRIYGETLLAKGDVPGAMKAFQEGARIDPNDILIQVALGDALLADNHFKEALEAYQMVAKNAPKSPVPHRRLARALAGRAGTDLTQYEASLAQIQQARELTLPSDTQSYQEDYIALMRLMETRLTEMLDELQTDYQARVQGKRNGNELLRLTADLKQRAEAVADYLDKLPAAVGQDVTHEHYKLTSALLLQGIGFFRDVVVKGDDHFVDNMKAVQVQAQRELTTASKRLLNARTPGDASGSKTPVKESAAP